MTPLISNKGEICIVGAVGRVMFSLSQFEINYTDKHLCEGNIAVLLKSYVKS